MPRPAQVYVCRCGVASAVYIPLNGHPRPPDGWIIVGSYDWCPRHSTEAIEYEQALEDWFERRRQWEKRHPRPRPHFENGVTE